MEIIKEIIKQALWVKAEEETLVNHPNKTLGINERIKDRGNTPSRKAPSPTQMAKKKRERNRVNGIVDDIMSKTKGWHNSEPGEWSGKTRVERKKQVNDEIDWNKVSDDFNFIAEWNDQIVNDVVKKLDEYHKIEEN